MSAQLTGENREKFLKVLQSQLVSCVVLDGQNGVSERLLFKRMKDNWNLRIGDVYAKLGVNSIRGLIGLFGNKFYMVNSLVYLSTPGANNGVKEAIELIRNTNKAIEANRLAAGRRYRPSVFTSSALPRSSSNMLRKSFSRLSVPSSNHVPCGRTLPPVLSTFVLRAPLSPANSSSSTLCGRISSSPSTLSTSILHEQVQAPPTSSNGLRERVLIKRETVESRPAPRRPQIAPGFKRFVLAHVSDAPAVAGSLAHSEFAESLNTTQSQIDEEQQVEQLNWEELEKAFNQCLIRERETGLIPFEEDDL